MERAQFHKPAPSKGEGWVGVKYETFVASINTA